MGTEWTIAPKGGKMKTALIMAVAGHFLCGVSDCLLSYSKTGRLNFRDIKDPEKMAEMFRDMPLSYPMISMILGALSIVMFSFGYFALSDWMKQYSESAAKIMFVSAVIFSILIVTHHVFCGIVEWFYIRLDRTDAVRSAVFEMQKKTICTMFAGYAGWLVFLVTLFVMVIGGNTALPAWGCIFNTAVFMLMLLPTKLPAKGNIAGTMMFLGLCF